MLKGASFAVKRGESIALAGENGAGKSTLMKIVAGLYDADDGEVFVEGKQFRSHSAHFMHKAGVVMVPQELEPIEHLTVYENIYVGREMTLRGTGVLNKRAMIASTASLLERFQLRINPRTKMNELMMGEKQLVEIAKAIDSGARCVMLDEPTSSLSVEEVDRLFRILHELKDSGVALVFTTHKMQEVRELADRVVVLRDGALTLDQPMSTVTDDDIVSAMIGRELGQLFPADREPGTETVLTAEGVRIEGASRDVSFRLAKGEILGLAGLVGSGRTEFLEALFGLRPRIEGVVTVEGAGLPSLSPSQAIDAGLALVPEERKSSGIVPLLSVLDNATLPGLKQFSPGGILRNKHRRERIGDVMAQLQLKSRGLNQQVGTLSGGNQQKVVIGKWMLGDIKVLLLDEPTRGVDIGARGEIYRIIRDMAEEGLAVIMASSDMPEVLGLSHRVLVFAEGGSVGELHRSEFSDPGIQERLFELASTEIPRSTEAVA